MTSLARFRFTSPPFDAGLWRHRFRGAASRWCLWTRTVLVALAIGGCGGGPDSPLSSPVRRIRVIGLAGILVVGERVQLSAVDDTERPVSPVWSSSAQSVATVSNDGLVTALGPGTALIGATVGSLHGEASVIVVALDGVERASILPAGEFGDTLVLAPRRTLALDAYSHADRGGGWIRANAATWASSDAAVATVDQTGAVTAVAPGVATIRANVHSLLAERTVRVAPMNGTAAIRIINVIDTAVTMSLGDGVTAVVDGLSSSELTIPAGTLQLSFDGIPRLSSMVGPEYYALRTFLGFLPAGAHETFVTVNNAPSTAYYGRSIAWLHDPIDTISATAAYVRVVFAVQTTYLDAYNVFITNVGERASVLTLQGCYLDWPFAYTEYAARTPGNFDIVLLREKFSVNPTAPEAARFHVTAAAGHATTFVIVGNDASALKVLSVVDR